MSTQCNRFVQNAWKKELCSNCFKPREEHTATDDILRLNIEKASTNLKIDHFQLQSILRSKTICRKDQRKKNVGFPESLTEVIGYGGDDFSDGEEEREAEIDSSTKAADLVPDSEEERALLYLTRANTNFNMNSANLTTDVVDNDSTKSSTTTTMTTTTTTPAKSFTSLMLGKIQRDADGKKTTLLVSVTPFGGDESISTAKRPIDRKVNLQTSPLRCKSDGGTSDNTAETAKKLNGVERKKIDEQEQKSSPELGKIIDMPLITSSNMISVMRKKTDVTNVNAVKTSAETTTEKHSSFCKIDKRNAVNVPLDSNVSAIKKIEIQMSKTSLPSSIKESESAKETATMRSECPRRDEEKKKDEGIELALTSLKNEEAPESDRSMSSVNDKTIVNDKVSLPLMREIDEEITKEQRFCFEHSRELAGEPDGRADEEETTEPPALPTSPPPSVISTEPRTSFLHGNNNNESRVKPVVPQKPMTFSTKASLHDGPLSVVRKISNDYVPPPPSVQNATCRSARNLGMQDMSSQHSVKKDISNETSSEINQVSSTTTQNSKESVSLSLSTSLITPPDSSNRSNNGEIENENVAPDEEFPEITPVSVSTMELVRSPNKRRMAPRPPETTEDPLPVSSLFARNPGANLKSDSPVVREKEKRERSSSCSPKFRKAVCELPDPMNGTTDAKQSIESVPRRTISLSQDSLTSEKEVREEKKRGRNRRGFSLKRFLRMGSRKDMDVVVGQSGKSDEIPSTSQPKPRLEIIHPLELDGAAVEVVVGNDRVAVTRIVGEDQTDSCGAKSDGSRAATRFPPSSMARPGKPPPPPRNQSLEDWSRLDSANKPVRSLPLRAETKPSVASPSRGDKMSSKATWRPTTATTSDSIYANLGEVRSALAPSKPQRTASMRDCTVSQPIPRRTHSDNVTLATTGVVNQHHRDYDIGLATVRSTSNSPTSNDSHVYECLSSSPECDSNLELRHGHRHGDGFRGACKRKSDSSAMGGEPKVHHHQPFVRSTSLPYCGSETESELYAPYTFYTGDEGAEEDQDWKDDEPRMGRLRQCRGRTIVHRSLEDNYGAVVVANHEALAQFLEQENQAVQFPAGLRALKNANPQLKHFNIDVASSIFIGRRMFCSATWNDQNVTLCMTFDLAMPLPQKDFYLTPIIEFVDRAPKEMIDKIRPSANKDVKVTVSVLLCLHVTTIQSFGAISRDISIENANREASFVLLQLVNALKSLQARGIEDANGSLNDIILCRENVYYRLYLLQGRLNIDPSDESREERVSLCECALIALRQLHLTNELPLVQDLLMHEKAVTLSQVKSVLEFSLWGPADVPLGGPREREVALQRWLDLERANVLHALVKTKAALTIIDEYQLLFLVRTTAKIMSEASMLLDEQQNRLVQRC